MLNIAVRPPQLVDHSASDTGGAGLDAAEVARHLRQQWPIIATVVAVLVLGAVIYLLTARPLFTATMSIMIDTRKNQLFQNQQVIGDQQVDAGMVESQVEILKSEGVALSVVRELKLADEGEFVRPGGSVLGTLASFISGDPNRSLSQTQLERRAVGVFLSNIAVRRVGLTYVLEVNYTSPNPAMAARVANGIADAYMVGELDARYQATKRASRWLQDRIQELRVQAQMADEVVQKFKTDNDIVGTNRGLIGDQQLGDVNGQLVTARATTAEAKAKLDRITEVARGDVPDSNVTDALRSDIITRLRAQYLDLSAKESDWSVRFGKNHLAVQNLRNQMREIRNSIAEELNRIAQTFKSDYQIALAREQSVQDSLANLVGQSATIGQAQVRLRDLESSAQTARNLYDIFLQRSMEATQQQTFPITDARVITAATEPARKSHPKSAVILAGACLGGLVLGTGVALARGRLDKAFRTVADVERTLGQQALGIIPVVRSKILPQPINLLEQVTHKEVASPMNARLTRYAVEHAFSRGAETLRSVKVEIDSRGLVHEMKVIGITSSIPREGKTTVAANLAQMVAHSGRKTILIDGDMRNPSLTRTLAPDTELGLINVLTGTTSESDVLWTDPVTGLHVLPANLREKPVHTAELMSSKAMTDLLARLRDSYDYVFVDLPPALPVVDVRATAHNMDGIIFVVEWGRTDRDVVLETLNSSDTLQQRILGIVLNKASPSALKRVETYKGRYYRSYYS